MTEPASNVAASGRTTVETASSPWSRAGTLSAPTSTTVATPKSTMAGVDDMKAKASPS